MVGPEGEEPSELRSARGVPPYDDLAHLAPALTDAIVLTPGTANQGTNTGSSKSTNPFSSAGKWNNLRDNNRAKWGKSGSSSK